MGKGAKQLACRIESRTTGTHQTSPGCGNLVLAPTHTTSGATSVRAPWTVAERASSTRICLANYEPGSGPNKPTNGFVAGTGICIKMFDDVP